MRGLLALTTLLVGVPVFAQTAVISASSPTTLNQGNLRQATVSVTLTAAATYAAGADASHFTLTTAVPGLTVHSVAFNSGRTVATLRLHYDGSDFDAAATIAVTVATAGTSHNAALTTGTQAVSPARWVNVSANTVALVEGGSAGTYTVVLESAPTGNVTLTVGSDNAAVTVDTDASPLTRTLTFTTTNWATAQTVTVRPVDDNSDTVDEVALVTNIATGGGYNSSTVADRTVRVTVADDERTGTDYDADDDQLIEIDSLAKLNAMRWDVDGNGAVAAGNAADYAAAFPGAATGMGCPDGGDSDQLSDGCMGYELTANLDFDTNGDGNVDASDAYPNWTPISALGRTFHGNNHTISNLTTSGGGRERGLFARLGGSARVSNLGLVDFAVSRSTAASSAYAGALAGDSLGTIAAVHVRGGMVSVSASGALSDALAGGLVGRQAGGSITACYSTAAVSARGNVSFSGGLAGIANNAAVSVSYAAGAVSGRADLTVRFGGLLGGADGTTVVTNSYAATSVTGTVSSGGSLLLRGLVARRLFDSSTAAASYWDSEATGLSSSALGTAQTTSALQTPTAYGSGGTDIYAYWDDYDTDGDGRIDAADDAWDFGTSSQYPSLKFGVPPLEEADEPQAASRVPTEVRTETTSQGLLVTWRPAAGATAYLVQWRQSGEAWSASRQAETTETRYEIAGLPAGVYEVRVLPVFDGEAGEPSAPARGESGVSNRPPLARDIAGMTLNVGGTAEVDLEATFSDPDGDALRYAASADGNAVEARVSGGTLRLRGLRPGEATVTVTATDPEGLSASATFMVRVGATLSLHGNPAVPEGGVVALRAELSRPLASDVEVGWRMAPDGDPTTADADGADFGAWAGTATIAAGETRTQIVVAVLDDEEIEPARERFAVELVEPEEDDNVGLSARAWRVLGSVQEGVCDRTPEVRAELYRGWRDCHWPRPSDLAGRATLDLRGRGAESLRTDDLLGLSGLRTLDIGSNALRELPTILLSHSPHLRTLRLDGNRLESLPAGMFAGVSGLRELRLSGNPGAPFTLAPELRRGDAEPWAVGPATVEAHLPLGAPFAMRLALTTVGGEASAEELALAAGAVASGAVQVSGDGPVRVSLAAPTIPETRCDDGPCFDGLTAQGATLALFAAPPSVAGDVAPADLLGAGDARIDLSAHFAAGGGGVLTYSATVDDQRLATVSVDGSVLTVAANEDGEEGTATVTVVATDDFGQTATLRFAVEVSPRPVGRWRGWRTTLTPSAAVSQ